MASGRLKVVSFTWFYRVVEISDFYNKGVQTSYAIITNAGGIINQNKGYPGTEKNIPPLVYEGE